MVKCRLLDEGTNIWNQNINKWDQRINYEVKVNLKLYINELIFFNKYTELVNSRPYSFYQLKHIILLLEKEIGQRRVKVIERESSPFTS